jgi:N-carbamoyl-L-amino-acid hydrolase
MNGNPMTLIQFPPLNAARLNARVEALSRITRPEAPWTRRAFSPLFMEARAWLREEFAAVGLEVRQDAGGNLIGRRPGDGRRGRPIITGSHCDTVVGGGRFDGIIGVLAGVEVAHTLHEHNIALAHPFEVIDFLSEEPSDYGISCVGSRAFSGRLEAAMLAAKNADGESLGEALRRMGADPGMLSTPLRAPGSTAAFVELHIEQGPVLEQHAVPIGVVTHIVGIRRVLITVTGRPDHAGTTPMKFRRDALVGAARLIVETHRMASQMSGNPHYVVATVGRIAVTPNVPNAVPGTVELMLEVRSDDNAVLSTFPESLLAAMSGDLTALRLSAKTADVSRADPTGCEPLVMDAVERAAKRLGYGSMRLPSGAGHDAVYVAPTGPIGMIFIPCLGGRSHCPEEWIDAGQLLDGTRVLYETILELDETLLKIR